MKIKATWNLSYKVVYDEKRNPFVSQSGAYW